MMSEAFEWWLLLFIIRKDKQKPNTVRFSERAGHFAGSLSTYVETSDRNNSYGYQKVRSSSILFELKGGIKNAPFGMKAKNTALGCLPPRGMAECRRRIGTTVATSLLTACHIIADHIARTKWVYRRFLLDKENARLGKSLGNSGIKIFCRNSINYAVILCVCSTRACTIF